MCRSSDYSYVLLLEPRDHLVSYVFAPPALVFFNTGSELSVTKFVTNTLQCIPVDNGGSRGSYEPPFENK